MIVSMAAFPHAFILNRLAVVRRRSGRESPRPLATFAIEPSRCASPPATSTQAHASAQTDVSYCVHECNHHKPTNSADSKSNNQGPGKKYSKKKKKKGKGGEKQNAKKVYKGARDGRSDVKPQKKKKAREHEDSDQASSDEDSETEDGPPKKWKSKQANTPEARTKAKRAGEYTNLWAPTPHRQTLSSVVPHDERRWTEQRRALEYSARRTQDAIDAARNADREEAERWITEYGTALQHGARQWLKERDAMRFGQAVTGFYRPSHKGLTSALDRERGDSKRVSFANQPPIEPNTPFCPPFPQEWKPYINFSNRDENRSPGSLKAPLHVFQDDGRFWTQDGQEIVIVPKLSQAPGVCRPLGLSSNDPRTLRRTTSGHRLQEVSGNVGRAADMNWQDSFKQISKNGPADSQKRESQSGGGRHRSEAESGNWKATNGNGSDGVGSTAWRDLDQTGRGSNRKVWRAGSSNGEGDQGEGHRWNSLRDHENNSVGANGNQNGGRNDDNQWGSTSNGNRNSEGERGKPLGAYSSQNKHNGARGGAGLVNKQNYQGSGWGDHDANHWNGGHPEHAGHRSWGGSSIDHQGRISSPAGHNGNQSWGCNSPSNQNNKGWRNSNSNDPTNNNWAHGDNLPWTGTAADEDRQRYTNSPALWNNNDSNGW